MSVMPLPTAARSVDRVVIDWEPDAVARLDHAHLAAWDADPRQQVAFTASLQLYLRSQPDSDVCALHGRYINSLDSFCHQLERTVPIPRLDRAIDGRSGVVAALRDRDALSAQGIARARYIVWNDADVLLRTDAELFGALVEAFAGVAAEWEYVSEDMLVVQRCVFVGGPELAEYAADQSSQFNAWKGDGSSLPFWAAVTGLDAPTVEAERIGLLMS